MTALDAKQESAQSARATRALVDIGRVLSLEPSLADAFDRVVGILKTIVSADRVVITSFDNDGRYLVDEHISGVHIPGRTTEDVLPIAGTISGYVMDHPEPLVHDESNYKEILAQVPDMKVVIDAGFKSGVSCALQSQERQIGILHVRSLEPATYGNSEITFISSVADAISGSLASEQLRRELERKADEEGVLARIGQTIASSAEIKDIYPLFADQVAKLIQFDRLVISLVDKARDELVDEYVVGKHIDGLEDPTRPPLTTPEKYIAMQENRLISLDESALLARASESEATRLALAAGLRSMLIVPLIWRDNPIGTLNFRSINPDGYGQHDIRLAESVAAQISGVVATSQLRDDTAKVAGVREGLAEIGRIVSSSLSIEDVYSQFAEAAQKIIDFDRVVVMLLPPGSGEIEIAYVYGTVMEGSAVGTRIPISVSSRQSVILNGETIVSDEAATRRESKNITIQNTALEVGLLSRLTTPLEWQGSIIGCLDFRSKKSQAFDEEEIRTAQAIAVQISGGIQSTLLYEEQQHETRVQEALASITSAASSGLEQDDVFSRVADELLPLIPYDGFSISLIEESDPSVLTIAYVRGLEVDLLRLGDHPINREGPGVPWKWHTTAVIEPISQGLTSQNQASHSETEMTSWIEAPLGISDEDLLGYISIRSGDAYQYTLQDQELLRRVAAHITPSINNIKLHIALGEEAREKELLAEIGRVTGDSASVSEMFGHLNQLVPQLVPADGIGLSLIEKGTGQLRIVESDRRDRLGRPVRGIRMPFRPGIGAEAFDSKKTIRFSPRDVSEIEGRAPNLVPLFEEGSRSFMVTPIISSREVIGTMFFESHAESAFDKRHANLAERIARQIAGRLETADLHEQIQREARVNELLAEIGRVVNSAGSIREMFHDMKPLARELLPIDGLALAIINAGESVAHLIQVDTGSVLPARPDGQRDIPLAGTLTQAAYSEQRTILVSPPEGDDPLAAYPSLKTLFDGGARSFLAVPLVSQGKALGTLVMFSTEYEAFSPTDVNSAERMVSQISGLIETFSLQERLKEEAETNQALADVGRLVNSSQSVQGMFAATKQIIRELIPSDGIGLTLIDRESETFRVIDADLGEFVSEADAVLSEPRPLSGSFTHALSHSKKPILCIPDDGDDLTSQYPGLQSIHDSGGRSVVGAPIIAQGKNLGALVAYSKHSGAYVDHHAILLERVANQMAGMVETAQLLEEVRKLANTVEASPDFVALTDSAMRIKYINQAGRDLLGINADDPVPEGLTGYDLFDSEGRKVVEEVGIPEANEHGFWYGEPRAVRIDGTEFPVEALIVPVDGGASTNNQLAYSIHYRDSSRRLQAMEAAAESEERYRDLFDNADELIQSVDADGKFEYVNKAWLNRLGYTANELDGMNVWDIIHPDSSQKSRIYFGLLLAGNAVGEVEAIFQTKSGEAIYVRGTANPKIEAGTLISSREIYRDISARMALERIKDEFVSVVSHELRTPLTSLRASLGLLAGGVLDDQPEKTGRMLEVALSNTERLVRLINDILDVERIESGLVTMDIQPWNVRELLEQASGEMSSLAGASGVSLKVESSPDLTMLIDRDRMIQTLANLISNAIKFSDPGTDVLVRAYADDSRVVVEIQDHGRGIPSEKLETVFDKFQQVDASDSREMGGTGLGLTICKSIIEQHGGEITVESIEGEGSTFTFWVPVVPERFVSPDSALDLSVRTV